MQTHRTSFASLSALVLTGVIVVACGSTGPDSGFDEGASTGADGGNGSSAGFGDGTGTGTGTGSTDPTGDGGTSCAAQTAVATRAPAYLYFLFDKSGSMGLDPYGDPVLKLNPVSAAFRGFVESATSTGIQATMTLFPDTSTDACAVSSYTTPDVALSALPGSAASFVAKLPSVAQLGDANDGTPTLPALRGVLPAAKANQDALKAANKDGKTVVILITDGEPNNCTGNNIAAGDRNNIDNIKAEVARYAATVPTYVIGVGTNSANLNAIATSGGTTAINIDVGNPAVTNAQLIAEIDKIRLSALSCDLAIPSPPAGQTLDLAKVNVAYTPSNGAKQSLVYDVACTAGGWHFDDANNATKIVLCPTTCNTAKADPNAVVGVEFGCARRDTGIK